MPIRWTCAARLADLLNVSDDEAFASPGQPGERVAVCVGPPGDDAKAEQISVVPTSGDLSVPVLGGLPLTIDDEFTLEVRFLVAKPVPDTAAAGTRCDEIATAIVGTVAATGDLDDLDGVLFAVPAGYEVKPPGLDAEGFWIAGTVSVFVRTRTEGAAP